MTAQDLLVWPDGIATGLCRMCHRTVLIPVERKAADSG
jgi:hypothetical protein